MTSVSLKNESLQYIAIYYDGSIFNETDVRETKQFCSDQKVPYHKVWLGLVFDSRMPKNKFDQCNQIGGCQLESWYPTEPATQEPPK